MYKIFRITSLMVLLTAVISVQAADKIRPFVLASNAEADFSVTVESVKAKLTEAGFELVGNYQPYDGVDIEIVTSDALKKAAAQSENGGFGAVIRVSITQSDQNIQVAYVNPRYMSAVYRMKSDLSGVTAALAEHLGAEKEFGSKKGMTAKKARKYHYMAFMPYFDDVDELGEYDSHDEAVKGVEKALDDGVAGINKVYRVDIPGTEMVLFGVSISDGKGADTKVMPIIDKDELKHSAHLPYEMMVNGKEVIALPGKFRIAQSFPDLGMGSFMKIQSAPGAIADKLEEVTEANE